MTQRLKPIRDDQCIYPYVFSEDIDKFHDEEWRKKFDDLMYGSTCSGVTVDGVMKPIIYYHDYARFANVIEKNTPPYFD